ncbi:uncharacterized protein PG986_008884 [Apiospora aurea]|uniref:Uncharacterized protein n=1 Tax=Apiospora aurea TaxID=335848 RepID=A0ABR1Q697_9PEZI
MGRFWGCTSCIGLLAVAMLTRETAANHDARYKIHRIEKEYAVLRRRGDSCGAGNTACPASLGGECCPDNYACASTYCYATTAGPSTACGRVGYHNCGAEMPGQCCPDNYVCGKDQQCTPPVGQGYPQSCPTNYYLCPSSMQYGCCLNGMGCAKGGCYSTNPSTDVFSTPTVATDSEGRVVTSQVTYTTTMTPTPTSVAYNEPGVVPKLVASTISKIPAIQTGQNNSSNSTGLSTAALGGIVAGVVVVLLVVIVAAFIIIRRLRQTEKAVEVSKRGSSNGQQTSSSRKSHKEGFGSTTVTEVDIDPLSQETPSLRPSRYRAGSDSSYNGRYSSPARSPPLSDGRSTPPAWPGNYKPVFNGGNDGTRHPSIESMGGQYAAQRVSYESQSTYRPGRWSNASEVSGSADGAHGQSELDAIETAGRRRSSATTRPTGGSRRQSGDSVYRGRSESAAAGTLAPLEAVNEAAELHGYYGPQDKQVGQTAARPASTGGLQEGVDFLSGNKVSLMRGGLQFIMHKSHTESRRSKAISQDMPLLPSSIQRVWRWCRVGILNLFVALPAHATGLV